MVNLRATEGQTAEVQTAAVWELVGASPAVVIYVSDQTFITGTLDQSLLFSDEMCDVDFGTEQNSVSVYGIV